MAYDSIASIPMTTSNARDFGKKKRTNRSAKLKQSKLDLRREQWLSQGKNRGSKEELSDCGRMLVGRNDGEKEMNRSLEKMEKMEKLEIAPRSGESNESMHQFSDTESLSNSPTSQISSVECGTNFTGSSGSSSSSSSSSGGSSSGSMTEEDEEVDNDDDCLDDWEAVADALAATDEKAEKENRNLNLNSENAAKLCSLPELHTSEPTDPVKPKAWRPDDAFRPQSLPNLRKQHSFPMNSERHYCGGGKPWACEDSKSPPTSCPICFEDLDLTDSSFLPCPCEFRLCLFCHKRILEQDSRCPNCRKQYEYRGAVEAEATLDGGNVKFRLARSCSMITRRS
jgi:hypothetical protein